MKHHNINYLEIPCSNIDATKRFFGEVFSWKFVDYGPDYSCFTGLQIDGGFYSSPARMNSEKGSALIVIYSSQLEETQKQITDKGGMISKAIFTFPGGRRFHFEDPSGSEFAVWSE